MTGAYMAKGNGNGNGRLRPPSVRMPTKGSLRGTDDEAGAQVYGFVKRRAKEIRERPDEEVQALLAKYETKKWSAEALVLIKSLLSKWITLRLDPVGRKDLAKLCRASSGNEITAIIMRMRQMLADIYNLDLINDPGTGYMIGSRGEMTLSEVVKSLFRSFGHIQSALKRLNSFKWLEAELGERNKPTLQVVRSLLNMIASFMGSCETELRNAISDLDEIQAEVGGFPEKLDYDHEEHRKALLRIHDQLERLTSYARKRGFQETIPFVED